MSVKIIKEAENTNYEEKFKEFLDSIDFQTLNNHVSDLLGVKVNLTVSSFETRGNICYVSLLDSTNYIYQCGIMSPIFESVQIDAINSVIREDEKTGELYFWCNPHFSYEYLGGGSNGAGICRAIYNDSKWNFRDYTRR